MKRTFIKFLLFFCFAIIPNLHLKAQIFFFPGVSTSPSPCYGGSDYTIYSTIHITAVEITAIDYDDGISNGSFHYKVYFTYSNQFVGTIGTESPNFYNYEVSMYTENPNINSNVITNSAGSSIPIATAIEDSITLGTNPQYNGSASAYGLVLGGVYTNHDSIAFLGYDSVRLVIDGPCLSVNQADSVTPLPVQLGRLDATVVNDNIHLQWLTYMEENNTGFRIEKSMDGIHWSILNWIDTKAKNGNSKTLLQYDYDDTKPSFGNNFYRLIQINNNSRQVISNIAKATYSGMSTKNVTVFPLPGHDILNIQTNSTVTAAFQLCNMTGSILYTGTLQNGTAQINTTQIPDGFYIIKLGADNIKVVVHH